MSYNLNEKTNTYKTWKTSKKKLLIKMCILYFYKLTTSYSFFIKKTVLRIKDKRLHVAQIKLLPNTIFNCNCGSFLGSQKIVYWFMLHLLHVD